MNQPSSYPTISIIIPVYNVQNYIVRCLESIAAQTYQGEMECILVDDCGTDQSTQRIEQFISSYQGHIEFKLIRLNHNQGPSGARNAGLKESHGELFTFVDSDDWIEPNMYEKLYNLLSQDPQALFVTSGIIAETPTGAEYGHANTDKYEEGGIIEPYPFLELLLATKTNYSLYNKLYRREFFKFPFREGIKIGEDLLFFYDNCKSLIDKDCYFITTPKAYYHYVIHPGSIMSQDSQSSKPWYVDFMVAMAFILDDSKHTYPDLYDIQINRFATVFGTYFYEIVNNKSFTTLRADTLCNLNRYVRVMDKHKFSLMTKTDMFIASHFSNGYSVVRHIAKFRKSIKSLVKH